MRVIFKRNGQLECAEVNRIYMNNGHLCLTINNEYIISKININKDKMQEYIETAYYNDIVNLKHIDFITDTDMSIVKSSTESVKSSDLLIDASLSVRAYNCLVNYIRQLELYNRTNHQEYTLTDVYLNIPYLKAIRNCGERTAKEITELFDSLGFDVTHWKIETKIWNTAKQCYTDTELDVMKNEIQKKFDMKEYESNKKEI